MTLVPVRSTETATVYDSASPLYRFLHRTAAKLKREFLATVRHPVMPSALRKELARYKYAAKHRRSLQEPQEARVVHSDGTETRFVYLPEPTLRERVRAARVARRRDIPAVRHDTGAFPLVLPAGKHEEDTWSWRTADEWTRRQQRTINNAQMVNSNAQGPLAP